MVRFNSRFEISMTLELTQAQGGDEQQRAQELSLRRTRPPCDLPGYEPRRFLGSGAFGEVWVALDRNTSRQVAIKFYAHRGGLDWSLLSREVEKLAFLSADRYVVQLLEVGWDSEPPYYVMEYVEQGSLEDRLKNQGPMAAEEAVNLFREIVTGLLHAHNKGVLHCDLKPANILLDQDTKPRLADFGQSRLSHEQLPALGTLFYMAPEQADLKAMPDARWDVYALGALLYAMLTGTPPHREEASVTMLERAENLDDRLARYQRLIQNAPLAARHRDVPGVDRPLAEIVDQCLAVDPEERYSNVQSVLSALDARTRRRARRPLVVLGAIGPAILLLLMSFVAWRVASGLVADSNVALTKRALESNRFAAEYVAKAVANEVEKRYVEVEKIANDPLFQEHLSRALSDPDMTMSRSKLSDPELDEETLGPLREQFRDSATRKLLQRYLDDLNREPQVPVASWFITDSRGLQLARTPDDQTIGCNFGWRSYFHGRTEDHPFDWRPGSDEHIKETALSPVFRSQATNNWVVAISTPVYRNHTFLGVVTLTVEVGRLIDLQPSEQQFAVLVDDRKGPHRGLILQHPLFERLLKEEKKLPDRFQDYRMSHDDLPDDPAHREHYVDPLGRDPLGADFARPWLAEESPVKVNGVENGWTVIVQQSYDAAIGGTLQQLKNKLQASGILALGLATVVLTLLWGIVIRILNDQRPRTAVAHSSANVPSADVSASNVAPPTK